ncbi:MAG: hypothetical protein U9P70_04150 [Patescibacteria group bacterium]|nr:hypothetical protein [Patescibacteria group bacterium]
MKSQKAPQPYRDYGANINGLWSQHKRSMEPTIKKLNIIFQNQAGRILPDF